MSLDETKTVIADSPFSGPTFCPSNGNTWDLQCYALFSPAGSTNYPAHFGGSPGNNGWQLIGTFYKPGIVYLVIPCTWFQQQCWWYPSLFFGLYLGLFAVVARKAEIEGNALTYLMLSALNMSAIAQTAMGLLTPVIPLLLITLTVVYVVRFRKR
ncbi:MAG: hypothetical protein KGH74_05225 [Candidatus Micrarchaeota archaeon]|nr:hypothetical protein [Candidatus Micrarchaeota archaeon]